MTDEPEIDATPGVPISEVALRLGVPLPTLRSWELRYEIPHARTPGGRHRRYSPADLHALKLMRDLLARGLAARDAAERVTGLVHNTGPEAAFINEFLSGAALSDTAAMRAVLTAGRDAFGLGPCLDGVLMPAMQQVGFWWQTARCDIAQEHLATETARSWLYLQLQIAPQPSQGPVLLTCGPTDMHTIGLESLAVLLREAGVACRLLSDRPSTLAVTTAIEVNRPRALVVVSHLATGRRRALETIEAAHGLGVDIFYAGNAFIGARGRRTIPGSYLGTNLQAARDLLTAAVGSGTPSPADQPVG